MVPDLRPSRPLSAGPTLFFASSPTAWQGLHLRKDCSPAARSCAFAIPIVAAIVNEAKITDFIMLFSLRSPETIFGTDRAVVQSPLPPFNAPKPISVAAVRRHARRRSGRARPPRADRRRFAGNRARRGGDFGRASDAPLRI